MLLISLVILPLLIGLLAMLSRSEAARPIAFGGTLINLALTVLLWQQLSPAETQTFSMPWVKDLGFNISLHLDGLSMLLVLLTNLLLPIIVLAAWNGKYEKPHIFFGLMLFMQTGLLGVFLAADAVLFYLFWEAALIPVYFIAAFWGGERRSGITFKFFLYTIVGSLFMLVALAYLYVQTYELNGAYSAALNDIYETGRQLPRGTQFWVFWGLFLAFAIKMPIFPFHTWQPDTYTESPAPATMLLSGIMLKMGVYGAIRWLLPVVPEGVSFYGPTVVGLGIIGIIYGSVIALRQKDMKRLIAYSSFAHVGLMGAALFVRNIEALQGAVLQMLAHGVAVTGLFIVADIIERRTDTRDINALGGITQKSMSLTIYFTILMLGSVALPLTSGFVGEFLMLLGLFEYNKIGAAVAGTTIILGAVYMLRLFQGVMFGPTTRKTQEFAPLSTGEQLSLLPLVILVLWIGVYPQTFLSMTEPAVTEILKLIPAAY